MTHEAPRALQQARGILQDTAEEEPNVHVVPERIDVAERQVPDTGRRMPVMKQFQDVRAT